MNLSCCQAHASSLNPLEVWQQKLFKLIPILLLMCWQEISQHWAGDSFMTVYIIRLAWSSWPSSTLPKVLSCNNDTNIAFVYLAFARLRKLPDTSKDITTDCCRESLWSTKTSTSKMYTLDYFLININFFHLIWCTTPVNPGHKKPSCSQWELLPVST